jgi:hypothetical protein
MADVRFLIICGPPTLDPAALGFPPFEPRVATVAEWWYSWRLMSSNNRQLASGANSSWSRLIALDAINRLKSNIIEVRPRVQIDQNNGKWRWHAEHDGAEVAAGPHCYERERDCRGGFGKFLDAVPRAQVADSPLILRDIHGSAAGQSYGQLRRPTVRYGATHGAPRAGAASYRVPSDSKEARRWPA